jgi:hypothetical protein
MAASQRQSYHIDTNKIKMINILKLLIMYFYIVMVFLSLLTDTLSICSSLENGIFTPT